MTDHKTALEMALELAEVFEKLFKQAEAMHKGPITSVSDTHKLWPPYDGSGDFIPCEWLQQDYPKNNDLTELACRYHRETEAYDKTVCTGPVVDDVIYPLNSKELVLVNINARKTLKLIQHEATSKNIYPKDLMHEIRRVGLTGAWRRYQVES